jgi:uncharacterized protein YndB with AHSA1/START domain
MNTTTEKTVQIYRVYIKATPQAVWDAITTSEFAERYGYQAPVEYDLRPGGKFAGHASAAMREHGAPDVIIEGEILECDPPRKLVQTWNAIWGDEISKESTTLTYEIEEEYGQTRLTLTHDVTDAPEHAAQAAGDIPGAGGGWPMVLSDLKSLLETGKGMFEAD